MTTEEKRQAAVIASVMIRHVSDGASHIDQARESFESLARSMELFGFASEQISVVANIAGEIAKASEQAQTMVAAMEQVTLGALGEQPWQH